MLNSGYRMKRLLRLSSYLLVALCAVVALPSQDADFPEASAWINDLAGLISDSEEATLNTMLQQLEIESGTQIFVAVMARIPSGYTLEHYVNELFAHWQPGAQDADNGVLLALFSEDRKLRIEVGYGLEGRLSDATCQLIIDNDMIPQLREGNYFAAVYAGVQRVIAAVAPDYELPDSLRVSLENAAPLSDSGDEGLPLLIPLLFLLIALSFPLFFGAIILFAVLMGRKGLSAGGAGWQRNWSGSGSSRYSGSSFGSSSGFSSSSFSGGGGGSSGGGGASGSW